MKNFKVWAGKSSSRALAGGAKSLMMGILVRVKSAETEVDEEKKKW